MAGVVEKVEFFQDCFDRVVSAHDASWLLPVRKEAMDRFRALGFPTTRHEEWRFTDVSQLSRTSFESDDGEIHSVTEREVEPFRIVGCDGITLVFVNGRYCESLSSIGDLPEGIAVHSLAAALAGCSQHEQEHLARHAAFEDEAFVALNTALMSDGAVVRVDPRAVIDKPVHILHLSDAAGQPRASHPRTLIVAGERSRVTILESFASLGEGMCLRNAVTELILRDGASVDYYKITRENAASYHIGTLQLTLGCDSEASAHTFCFGQGTVRNNVNALLDGERGVCNLWGLYAADAEQHVDNHLVVDHAKPHCDSREFYKGVLNGSSRGVFSGRIVVREGAQKTDAKQTNMSLLLSADAQVESKPQLEIYADDVKCTHGATIGQIDEEAIFYLRSRGISAQAAKEILVYAFACEGMEEIRIDRLRKVVETLVADRIGRSTLNSGDL